MDQTIKICISDLTSEAPALTFYSLQDATHENIPIMMVGNKSDLRQTASEEGLKCVPLNYGEKLAMVRMTDPIAWKNKKDNIENRITY